ncbi:hypothetical protein H257_09202 [Aphanomyces astaci]|uniref:Uncharacterized protein n=1 Tax=Aphanomyces astaci TaxID=112090 RepID=W4GAP2_APHAT|nr:hypothetical protein H257_09202 [Aphanomyces astaci]ETV76735.1 hypothetical protein H257_09202 [Aphanomyces astaci]|eukprot:XP_009833647.1 hypothetical protein H257_09202 [Aphanomyces astaci]
MRFEPTSFEIDDGDGSDDESTTKPWLVGVPVQKAMPGDQVMQCAGIVKDGSRCTRTYTQTTSATVSFCFKHRHQQRTSTHGYAPLAQLDIQVPKQRQSNVVPSCRCRGAMHWTYQSMCAMFCLFLAIGLLFTSLVLEIPHIGLASAFFFCIPMVLLANCSSRYERLSRGKAADRPTSMAEFYACWVNRSKTLELLDVSLRDCTANANKELLAAICIQRIYRGQRVRADISRCREAEIVVARVFRGHLGRHTASQERRRQIHLEAQARLHHVARVIQTRYRGWASRKYKLNFATRKLYLKDLEAKGHALRDTLRQRLDAQRAAEAARVDAESRDELVRITQHLHHLVGTAVTPGIFSSPFLQSKPTAFGVPVETHIRTNTLNYLATVPKKLLPKSQLKPKPPAVRTSLQATSVYQVDKVYDDREKRYQKASQITEENFVTVVHPASTYAYDKSVNNGIEYLDPRKHPFCQRSANKSPVKSRESIVLPPATRPSSQALPHVKKKKPHSKRTVVE